MKLFLVHIKYQKHYNLIKEYQIINITRSSNKYIITNFYNNIPTTIKSVPKIGYFKRNLRIFNLEMYVDSWHVPIRHMLR